MNSEKIGKIWKKIKLNTDKIWKIQQKSRFNSEMIWKKGKSNSDDVDNMEERHVE